MPSPSPIYLDCNATTPLDPAAREVMLQYLGEEMGNAGSRTHGYGTRARKAVEQARRSVAEAVAAQEDEIVFTSGATESNNLALLGLAPHGVETKRRHIISSQLEHKAVLEPLEALEEQGFEVTYLSGQSDGSVSLDELEAVLREDTLLVSLMHVNNETGVIQPLDDIAAKLVDHPAYLHVDAAQGFGKLIEPLQHSRIDLMSISAHKVYGPKGVGALMVRRRRFKRPPLKPLLVGGGQERGLRPGTLPVPLIAGFGEATRQAVEHQAVRRERCEQIRTEALEELAALNPRVHGEPKSTIAHTLNFGVPGVDGEAAMVALKDLVAISNGSACTSTSYEPSHVLLAMGLSEREANEALRFSWCHLTPSPPWREIVERLGGLA